MNPGVQWLSWRCQPIMHTRVHSQESNDQAFLMPNSRAISVRTFWRSKSEQSSALHNHELRRVGCFARRDSDRLQWSINGYNISAYFNQRVRHICRLHIKSRVIQNTHHYYHVASFAFITAKTQSTFTHSRMRPTSLAQLAFVIDDQVALALLMLGLD